MISFGLIGCGRISYKHIEALVNNQSEAILSWTCDIEIEKALQKKEQYIEKVKSEVLITTEYKDILSDPGTDAVVIATESGYHGKIAIDALRAGKHILIEKPMAMTLNEIDQINQLADENNLKVAVSHQNRFNPPIQKLRRAIEEGRFGKIVNITARILWNRDQNYYDLAPWRGTKKLDGGTLMNQCIHNIDLLQWMAGSRVLRVKSELDTFLREIEMEDFGALLIRFENGTIGIIEGSACVYPKSLEETLSVFGEKGTVVIGGLAVNEIKTWQFSDYREYDDDLIESTIENVYGEGHTPLYTDFIHAIKFNKTPYIDGKEGRKAVEIILSAYNNIEKE